MKKRLILRAPPTICQGPRHHTKEVCPACLVLSHAAGNEVRCLTRETFFTKQDKSQRQTRILYTPIDRHPPCGHPSGSSLRQESGCNGQRSLCPPSTSRQSTHKRTTMRLTSIIFTRKTSKRPLSVLKYRSMSRLPRLQQKMESIFKEVSY